MMLVVKLAICVAGLLAVGIDAPLYGQTSTLWGEAGELWSPSGRLPDFSYAGYRTGSAPLPTITNRINIRDFGAVGNGTTDDSAAFQRAIDSAKPGQAVFVPSGAYRISNILYIRKANVVLQGQNQSSTVLSFDRSLAQITGKSTSSGLWFPHTTPPSDGLSWSFNGGLIWVQGEDFVDMSTHLTDVTAEAPRGDRALRVASTSGLKPDMWVRLAEFDPRSGNSNHGTLVRRLHGGLMSGGDEQRGKQLVWFLSRIVSINGSTVTLERHLPVDVKTMWRPELHVFDPTVEEVGIENLTIKMPDVRYPGHFKEQGFNGISLFMASNSWIRDVTILNADTAIFANFANFCTIRGVTISGESNRGSTNGHHGISFFFPGNDNLITEFSIRKKHVHDLTIEQYVSGNVFSNGSGVDINMDHHRAAPYQNLFTNIDLGRGSRAFQSSGGSRRGSQTAAYATFWNIRADAKFSLPSPNFGPLLNFVGLKTNATSASSSYDWHFERIEPTRLTPQNIHEAQLQRR